MANDRFSFSEDSLQEITDLYRHFLEGINEEIIKLIDIFREYKETTKYKVIGEEGNIIIDFYNDEVLRNIITISEDWTNSPESLKGMAQNLRVGEEAEEVAESLTNSLISYIEELLVRQDHIDLNDTAAVEMNTDIYNEISDAINKKVEKIENTIVEANRRYEELVEENTAAVALGVLMNAVEGSIITPFTELGNKVIAELQTIYEEGISTVRTTSEESAANAKENAQKTMSDSDKQLLEDMLKIFG
jgi:hypothetical protein